MWRQTYHCNPQEERDISKDQSCQSIIKSGNSGYCECENRRRVRESTCQHHEFTCEEACRNDASSQLELSEENEDVTYGSYVRLTHEETRGKLHSHEINYGSGSGQQSVTTIFSLDDTQNSWLIKEAHDAEPNEIGKAVMCGDAIRLEHIVTRRNLHTHNYLSPISRNSEVSAFGVAGEGDTSDTWIVECESSMTCDAETRTCSEGDGAWKRNDLVHFKNNATGKYLYTSIRNKYDDSNCPRCVINGQTEVSAVDKKNQYTMWFAYEGIYAKTN